MLPREVIDGVLESLLERNQRRPAEHLRGFGDIRLALLGIVLRKRAVDHAPALAGELTNSFRELHRGHLAWITEIDRITLLGAHQAVQAVHHIADIAEAARLS